MEEGVRIKDYGRSSWLMAHGKKRGEKKLMAHSYRHSRGSGNPELTVRKMSCEERSDAAIS
jgi:hypothetical protein